MPGDVKRAEVAVRVEEGSFREELAFLGPVGEKLLACTHLPPDTTKAGLVICSSLRAEFETNYRREILLGRGLAASGIAVQRFQYVGTGNSDGVTTETNLDTMIRDANRATEHFVSRYGIERVAFMGTRLGALVAAAVAARYSGAPLVLWHPVVEPRRYFREVFRSRRFWAAKTSADEAALRPGLEELRREGQIDVLGYPIDVGLFGSVMSSDLTADAVAHDGPILVIQLGAAPPDASAARFSEALRAGGTDISLHCVDEKESWWLEPAGERQEKRALTSSPAVETTRKWLQARLDSAVAP